MSKLDEKVDMYHDYLTKKLSVKADKDLLRKVTVGVGPNIYKKDASLVSSTDPDELGRVKNNFLIKKLGLKDDAKLDKAIDKVVGIFGSSNSQKHRAVFYYLLVKEFKKEGVYK